jgi:hypothetical protein
MAVWLMLALWLGTYALTASPQLHRLLHEDAPGLSHHCLVTQIQQHPLLVSLAAALVPLAMLCALLTPAWAVSQFCPVRDYRLPTSRAPPVRRLS